MRTGLAVLLILAVLCCTGCGPDPRYPPDPPLAPRGPDRTARNTGCWFSTLTRDRDGDSIRFQFFWGDGTRSDWSAFCAPGAACSASHAWSNTGTYSVRARARDSHGEVSDTSGPSAITVLESLPNRAPVTPEPPSGPAAGTLFIRYGFIATTTDPDGDEIAFRFDWDDGSTSAWTELVRSGGTVADSHAWTAPGTKSVRVMARDRHNVISDWSPPAAIDISARGPE